MPRNYKRKGPKCDAESLKAAKIMIETQGISIRAAAKANGVPRETLRRWISDPPMQVGAGRPPVLTAVEEELIVVAMEQCSSLAWPCGTDEIALMVKSYLDNLGKETPFKDNVPGEDWMISFKRRWQNRIRMRKPEVLTKARAENLNEVTLKSFFDMYQKVLSENGFFQSENAADRIFNADESGFATDPNKRKMFFKKSSRDSYLLSPTCGKAMYTVLVCGSASGIYLPPLVVYKGLNLYGSWCENGPEGTQYSHSPSGWMADTIFENWFKDTFIPFVSNLEKPVILMFDGHGSHLTYNTVKSAIDNMIIIICIPPSTSHALQPLDVGVFFPLKGRWRKILLRFYRESRMQSVEKGSFPSLLKQLWETVSSTHLINGFRKAGLWPFNQAAVSVEKCVAEADDIIVETEPGADTPRKALRQAIINAIAPPPSKDTEKALENAKKKRKRVQAKSGEVLTTPTVLQRLKDEAEARSAKQKEKKEKLRKNLLKKIEEDEEDVESESEEEEDNTTCSLCGQLWRKYTKKGQWLICDLCDQYICPKCVPRDTDYADDFYCTKCTS